MCVGVNAGKVFRAGFNGNKTQEQKSAERGTEDEFHRINISQVFVYSLRSEANGLFVPTADDLIHQALWDPRSVNECSKEGVIAKAFFSVFFVTIIAFAVNDWIDSEG